MSPIDGTVRDLVLGRLSEVEQERAAERVLTDDAFYEAAIAEEQQLIDEYNEGSLTDKDKLDFEKRCKADTDFFEQVAIARSLTRMAKSQSASASTILQMPPSRSSGRFQAPVILAVAASLFIGLASALTYVSLKYATEKQSAAVRQQIWQKQLSDQRARIAQLDNRIQSLETLQAQSPAGPGQRTPKSPVEPDNLLAYAPLIKPVSRGEGTIQRFAIANSARRVELQFNIDADRKFPSYRVVIEDRGAIISRSIVAPHVVGRFPAVSAIIPVTFTGEKRFEASVFGVNPGQPDELVEEYSFELVRQ